MLAKVQGKSGLFLFDLTSSTVSRSLIYTLLLKSEVVQDWIWSGCSICTSGRMSTSSLLVVVQ